MKHALPEAPTLGPPWRLSGRVYGTLLNHRSALAALGDSVDRPPYKAAPRAPVLYIKPRNTLASTGDDVVVPAGCDELEIGGCLGVVIGRTATNVAADRALECIAGYVAVNDISVPHDSYYRPAIRYKARDGFCPIGPAVVPTGSLGDPGALTVRVYVDGKLACEASQSELVRPLPRLIADVTEFMTLAAGDVLALGVAAPPPRARAGQVVRVQIDGIGHLENRLVSEAPVLS